MSTFEINVKFMSNPNIKVQVQPDTTVAELKQKLEASTSIKAVEIKLIYKGKILKVNDDKMADLSIAAESTVHMIQNKPTTESDSTSQTTTTNTNQPQAQPNAFPNPNQGFGGFGMPGLGGMQGIGGMPGMGGMGGMPGMGGMGGMDPAMMQQMMGNPQFRQMAQQLLSNPAMLRQMISNNPQLQQMTQNIPGFDAMITDPNLMSSVFGSTPGQPGTQPQTQPQMPFQAPPTQPQPNTQPNIQPNTQPPMPDLASMMNNPMVQQYMNSMGGNMPAFNPAQTPFGIPPQQPPANVNYEELYKDQLVHLKEMGFTNKEVNIDVLKQCYGNVEAAIERLLSMFN